jgi:hypothetical protein
MPQASFNAVLSPPYIHSTMPMLSNGEGLEWPMPGPDRVPNLLNLREATALPGVQLEPSMIQLGRHKRRFIIGHIWG